MGSYPPSLASRHPKFDLQSAAKHGFGTALEASADGAIMVSYAAMPTYTQYLTITKCTLLRLDSCNFIKLSETYLKKTDRDVVYFFYIFFILLFCVFTIIFPSANSAALYLSHNNLNEC